MSTRVALSTIRRFGYLLETFAIDAPRKIERLRRRLTSTYASLDQLLPKEGKFDARPLTENVVREFTRRAAWPVNLRNNRPHILRHTFCSPLAMRGAPARAIQELAGHRDLATTQRYMHLSLHAVEAAIRLLELPRSDHARGDIVETPEGKNANVQI